MEQAHPGCKCEAFILSEHSPGQVDDSEILARVMGEADVADGRAIPSRMKAALQGNGFSVNREGYMTDESWVQFLMSSGKTRFVAIATAKASDFRSKDLGDGTKFCVYDTAEPDNKAHAEVFGGGKFAKGEQPARRTLYELVETYLVIPRDQFRGGNVDALLGAQPEAN